MTEVEAKTVIEILCTADGGCGHCVRELLERFIKAFPDYADLVKKHD